MKAKGYVKAVTWGSQGLEITVVVRAQRNYSVNEYTANNEIAKEFPVFTTAYVEKVGN
jgi:hypothetical protein